MSSTTRNRRRQVQRLALTGIGSAVLLVGIVPAAGAAENVVIPLDPADVLLSAVPVENGGAMGSMTDPAEPIPVPVQFEGTLTIDLPAEYDTTEVQVDLYFDGDDDGTPEATYSSGSLGPDALAVSGEGTDSITVTLPADEGLGIDVAELLLVPSGTDLGEEFVATGATYTLGFDPTADAAVTVQPELLALSQVPCSLASGETCFFETPITAGSAVTLDLTDDSLLRELGITDLTGLLAALQPLEGDLSTGPLELDVQVGDDGRTATVAVPAGTAAGSYWLLIAQPTEFGASVVNVQIIVEESAPAVVPPAAEPTTPAAAPSTTTTTVNAGLRSNTGVEAVPAGSTGTVAVVAGAGLLLAAGVGGVAVARTRRRPAGEVGSCGA